MYSKSNKYELKMQKSSKIIPNCISCNQSFGVFHDQICSPNLSHDLPTIYSSQSFIRVPLIFKKCNHRICSQCLQDNDPSTPQQITLDDITGKNFIYCPECSNPSKGHSRNMSIPYSFNELERDAELFMECCIAQFTRDQIHFEQRNNKINKTLINEENHLKFKKLFSKYILCCDKCLCKSSENDNEEASCSSGLNQTEDEENDDLSNQHSYATHHCFCCRKWFCESCSKECRETSHQIFVIDDIKNKDCEVHSKPSNLYLKDDFICIECYVNFKSKPKNLLRYFLKDDDYKIALIEFKTKFEHLLKKIKNTIELIDAQKNLIKVKDIHIFGSNKCELEQMKFIVEQLIEIISNMTNLNEQNGNVKHLFVNLIEEKSSLRLLVEKNYKHLSKICNEKYDFLYKYVMSKNHQMYGINPKIASSNTLAQFSRDNNYNATINKKKTFHNNQNNSNTFINCEVYVDQTNYVKLGSKMRYLTRSKNYQICASYPYNSTSTDTTFESSEDAETSSNSSSSNSSENSLKNGSIIKNFELRFDSPDEIWIKLTNNNGLNLYIIDRMLRPWHATEKSKFSENEFEEIEPGQAVIYYSENKKLFYRARVKKIKKNKENENNVDIFYLELSDDGRYQTAKRSEIFKMKSDKDFSILKPLWLKCYLENLKPHESAETFTSAGSDKRTKWSKKVSELVTHWRSLASFKLKILSTKNENNYCSYGVDFIIDYIDLKNEKMEPVIVYYHIGEITLREALVHHKLASFVAENLSFKEKCLELRKKLPKYIVMNDLNKGEEIATTVIHYENLDEFFLKKIYYDKEFKETSERLRYSMNIDYEKNGHYYQILKPVEGMAVAAKYLDQGWFRGKIVNITPNNLQADVLFVDYANINCFNLTELRHLKRDYFQEEITTFKCKLFGIEFTSQENKDKASDYIRETTQVLWSNNINDVNITVKKIVEDENSFHPINKIYQVVMRYIVNNKLTNINVILTKLGFARCTDISIYDGEKEHIKQERVKKAQKEPTETQLEKEAKGLVDSIGTIKVFKAKPPNTILCNITNALSPSEIWLQDIVDANNYPDFEESLSQKCKQMLDDNLDKNLPDWQLNDLCLMRINSILNPKFFRGKIVEAESNGKYTILCLDTGIYEKSVCKENLFELTEELRSKPLFKAKRCTLIGVKPAGTQKNEWSRKAQSYTANNLNDNKVYVEFLSSNDLINPVCIYVEANSTRVKKNYDEEIEYVRFTDMLFSNGLAFLEERKEQLDKLIANCYQTSIETMLDKNNNEINLENS